MKNHSRLVLALLGSLSLFAHSASAEVCNPAPSQWFSGKGALATRQKRVLLVTHASREFNADPSTIQGIQNTINLLTPNSEVIYLHRGGFKNYMYPSCNPSYFYKSEGGDIKIDLDSADTVVMVGGYYSYCMGDTFTSVSKAIRNLKAPRDIRIIYVMDGDFEALGGLQSAGGLDAGQDQDLMARVGLTFNYVHMAQVLGSAGSAPDELENMLSSVYASEPFPAEYTVTGHFKNLYFPNVKADWVDWTVQSVPSGPKIDVYYLESKDLKSFLGLGSGL